MQCVLKLILITPVFPNCSVVSIGRLIEAILDVVVPDHSVPDDSNNPKPSTIRSVSRLLPFMRRNTNALPQLCFWRLHARFRREDQVPKLRLSNWRPVH